MTSIGENWHKHGRNLHKKWNKVLFTTVHKHVAGRGTRLMHKLGDLKNLHNYLLSVGCATINSKGNQIKYIILLFIVTNLFANFTISSWNTEIVQMYLPSNRNLTTTVYRILTSRWRNEYTSDWLETLKKNSTGQVIA